MAALLSSPKIIGFPIAALVLGLVALPICFFPLVGNIAVILGGIGLTLSIITLASLYKAGAQEGKKMAISATILCSIAVVLSLIVGHVWKQELSGILDGVGGSLASQSERSQSDDDGTPALDALLDALTKGDDSDKSGKSDKKAKKVPAVPEDGTADGKEDSEDEGNVFREDTKGDFNGLGMEIVSFRQSGRDMDNQPTGILTLEMTNGTKKTRSLNSTFLVRAYQHKRELDTAFYDIPPSEFDEKAASRDVQPDGSGRGMYAFVLADDSPVSIEVYPFGSFGSHMVTRTFPLEPEDLAQRKS